jgi:carboxyl-terminal processing protease
VLERRQDRLRLGIALAICLCLAYTAGFGVYGLRRELGLSRSTDDPAEVRVFWEAWNRVEEHFFGNVPSAQARTYSAIQRSLTLLDPYTVFVEPVSRELEQDRLRGAHAGIGVTVRRNADGQITLTPYSDSPAERACLARGDVLLAIDGEPVSDLPVSEVEIRLRGEVGTQVHLRLRRASGSSFEATIERERIEVPSLTWHMETATTGYVRLMGFTERTNRELDVALQELEEAHAGGLVLDLRQNNGGLLGPAVEVAGRFLEGGDVVLHQDGRGGQRTFRAEGEGDLSTPIVVLVDGGTASAAEIVAGALQDHDRAPLMGEPTFGKGSVQEIYDLSDGSSLHVTAAIWLTPDRHRIDKQGLTPDVVVPASDGLGDEPLGRAVSYLESE